MFRDVFKRVRARRLETGHRSCVLDALFSMVFQPFNHGVQGLRANSRMCMRHRRLPATELARVVEPHHAAMRTGLLSMLNQLSHGSTQGVTAWSAEIRCSVQEAARECIAAGLSFFFHKQAEKMAAIVRYQRSRHPRPLPRRSTQLNTRHLRVPPDAYPCGIVRSRLSQAMPGISSEHMATHPPLQPVDMIAGLLLNDISRPEMLLDLLNPRAASDLKVRRLARRAL